MLQDLLARRFKLAATHTKREMAVYEMTVVGDGSKLKPWVEPAPGQPLPSGGLRAAADGGVDRVMVGWHMATVAAWSGSELGRPVLDRTGLTGRYYLQLHWFPRSANIPGVDLIDALRIQYGLKLEPVHRMIDILVVDHVERTPTEN